MAPTVKYVISFLRETQYIAESNVSREGVRLYRS